MRRIGLTLAAIATGLPTAAALDGPAVWQRTTDVHVIPVVEVQALESGSALMRVLRLPDVRGRIVVRLAPPMPAPLRPARTVSASAASPAQLRDRADWRTPGTRCSPALHARRPRPCWRPTRASRERGPGGVGRDRRSAERFGRRIPGASRGR